MATNGSKNNKGLGRKEAESIENSHRNNFAKSLRGSPRITGLANLAASDLTTLDVESKDWGASINAKKKHAGEIPTPALEKRAVGGGWGGGGYHFGLAK